MPETPSGDSKSEKGVERATPLEQSLLDLQIANESVKGFESAAETFADNAGIERQRAEARDHLTDVAGRYVELSLVELAREKPAVNKLLEEKGVIDATGEWNLTSPAMEYLTGELAKVTPARIEGLQKYHQDTGDLNRGFRNRLEDWLNRYQQPRDARQGRPPPERLAA